LTYAVGRRLELSDQEAVEDLTKELANDGYRLRGLIQRVATSKPFLTK